MRKGELERNTAPLPSASGRLFMIVVRLVRSLGNEASWSSMKNALSRKRSDRYSSTSTPSSYHSASLSAATCRTNCIARYDDTPMGIQQSDQESGWTSTP